MPVLYIEYPLWGTGLSVDDDGNPAKNSKQEIWKQQTTLTTTPIANEWIITSSLVQSPTACVVTDFELFPSSPVSSNPISHSVFCYDFELSPSSPVQYPTVCFTDFSFFTVLSREKKPTIFDYCPCYWSFRCFARKNKNNHNNHQTNTRSAQKRK